MKKFLLYLFIAVFAITIISGVFTSKEDKEKYRLEAIIEDMQEAESTVDLESLFIQAKVILNETEFESIKGKEENVKNAHIKGEVKIEKKENDLQKIGAYLMAKQFVTSSLKSPTSANFPAFHEKGVYVSYDRNTKKASVQLYVDAQNSFGAMIRTRFQVDVVNTSGDNWRLINMQKVN